MCGIAGIVANNSDQVHQSITRMVGAQAHRGPDDSGSAVLAFGSQWLGLGHARLSIIDLSAAGHQPMVHAPTGNLLVFNGEIYNYQILRRQLEAIGEVFCGQSDTEVLLAALVRWGSTALPRLEGMYALAFYEPANGRLLLARDPLGIKPLYFSKAYGHMVFASEVRAVLASDRVSRKIDPAGVAGLLAYGSVQQPLTLFRDIYSSPPGSWLEFQATSSGFRESGPHRFWNYPPARQVSSPEGAVAEVASVLDSAVRDHLVADVPVGVFLSSGLDSTIIAGLAKRHTQCVQSFTVGFMDEPDFSELRLAGETAELFGLQHTEVHISTDEAEAAARDWISAIDLPSIDGLNIFVLSRAVCKRGIKVALSGQGGDELFGGYPSFGDVPHLWRFLRYTRYLPHWARRRLASIATTGKPLVQRAKLADMFASDGSLLSLYFHRRRLLSDMQMTTLGLSAANLALTADFLPPRCPRGCKP